MRVAMASIIGLLVCIEVIVILIISATGSQGVSAWYTMVNNNNALCHAVELVNRDYLDVKDKIKSWHDDSFYCEKIAREQLHMARASDIVIFINSRAKAVSQTQQ